LLGEFFEFAWDNKAWWIIPIVIVLFILMALIVGSGSLAPLMYPVF